MTIAYEHLAQVDIKRAHAKVIEILQELDQTGLSMPYEAESASESNPIRRLKESCELLSKIAFDIELQEKHPGWQLDLESEERIIEHYRMIDATCFQGTKVVGERPCVDAVITETAEGYMVCAWRPKDVSQPRIKHLKGSSLEEAIADAEGAIAFVANF